MRHLHPARPARVTPRFTVTPFARHDSATARVIAQGAANEAGQAACYDLIERLHGWCGWTADSPVECAALAVAAADLLGRPDPVVAAHAAALAGLDGALYQTGTGGWILLYEAGLDPAQARLVQAFLLGCYALRDPGAPPSSIEFRMADLDGVAEDDSLAAHAYAFATRLLMPLSTCRPALAGTMDFGLAERYAQQCGVPTVHVVRRWLAYTADKAVLMLTDGQRIHASWASETACAAGLHVGVPGPGLERPVPVGTLAADTACPDDVCGSLITAQRWFGSLAGMGMLREMKLVLPQQASDEEDGVAGDMDEVAAIADRARNAPRYATLLVLPRVPVRAGSQSRSREAWPHGCAQRPA